MANPNTYLKTISNGLKSSASIIDDGSDIARQIAEIRSGSGKVRDSYGKIIGGSDPRSFLPDNTLNVLLSQPFDASNLIDAWQSNHLVDPQSQKTRDAKRREKGYILKSLSPEQTTMFNNEMELRKQLAKQDSLRKKKEYLKNYHITKQIENNQIRTLDKYEQELHDMPDNLLQSNIAKLTGVPGVNPTEFRNYMLMPDGVRDYHGRNQSWDDAIRSYYDRRFKEDQRLSLNDWRSENRDHRNEQAREYYRKSEPYKREHGDYQKRTTNWWENYSDDQLLDMFRNDGNLDAYNAWFTKNFNGTLQNKLRNLYRVGLQNIESNGGSEYADLMSQQAPMDAYLGMKQYVIDHPEFRTESFADVMKEASKPMRRQLMNEETRKRSAEVPQSIVLSNVRGHHSKSPDEMKEDRSFSVATSGLGGERTDEYMNRAGGLLGSEDTEDFDRVMRQAFKDVSSTPEEGEDIFNKLITGDNKTVRKNSLYEGTASRFTGRSREFMKKKLEAVKQKLIENGVIGAED